MKSWKGQQIVTLPLNNYCCQRSLFTTSGWHFRILMWHRIRCRSVAVSPCRVVASSSVDCRVVAYSCSVKQKLWQLLLWGMSSRVTILFCFSLNPFHSPAFVNTTPVLQSIRTVQYCTVLYSVHEENSERKNSDILAETFYSVFC